MKAKGTRASAHSHENIQLGIMIDAHELDRVTYKTHGEEMSVRRPVMTVMMDVGNRKIVSYKIE